MMKALSDVDITPEDFEAWLKSFPPDTQVGYTRREDYCPLERYIASETGDPESLYLFVNRVHYGRYDVPYLGPGQTRLSKEEEWELPQFAKDFVAELDVNDYEAYPVTAAVALYTLHQVWQPEKGVSKR